MTSTFLDTLRDLLNSESVKSILRYFVSGRFVITVFTIVITVILVLIVNKSFRFAIRRQREINKDTTSGEKLTLLHVTRSVITGLLVIIAIIFILQINGLEVSSLITSVSIVSAIIGLALQDTIKDIIQGIQILSEKFFMVGDVIKFDNFEGKVTKFTIRSTKMIDIRSKNEITISNRNISKIEKASDKRFIDIPVSYDEPVEKMFKILPEICKKITAHEEIPESRLMGLKQIGDSAMIYQIMISCEPEYAPRLMRYANKVIVEELSAAGVKIPYPQMDVHFDNDKKADAAF